MLREHERFERHTLRLAADGADGCEMPSPNVVVDRAAADLQHLGGSIDGNRFHDKPEGNPHEASHEIQEFL